MAETALLVIDMQVGNFEGKWAIANGETLIGRVRALIGKAREANVPVVFVQHGGPAGAVDEPGTPGWKIHPSLEPASADVVVAKRHPDAFQETDLQTQLQALGVSRLVVAGLQTEYCVDTTCRRAYSLGYDVTLVSDAHGTWDSPLLAAPQIIAHHNSVLGGWFAKLAPAEEIAF